ncbi:MAG: LPS assembly lipoprotein LptE [Gammaproteobacteria bacterium]|nr:LPS assembly lipoprotein LptE [Gammaproteobacteria bacterium]
MKRMHLVWVTALGVVLTACGFHLRGHVSLSDKLSPLAVQTADLELREALVDLLETSGAQVVDEPGTAKAVLRVQDINYERRVRTIDSRGKVNGYLLVYSVNYKVETPGGDDLSALTPLSVRRDFNFDSNQVLQKEDEERDLRFEMERDMAQRIVRRMSRIAMVVPSRQFAAHSRVPAAG